MIYSVDNIICKVKFKIEDNIEDEIRKLLQEDAGGERDTTC